MADQNKLWPLKIDWKTGLVQSAEFNTKIFDSRDRHESRHAAREQPRFAYEYSGSARGAVAQAVARVLDTRIDEELIFANPIFRTEVVTALTPPGVVFTVDNTPDWLVDGENIVIDGPNGRHLAVADTVLGNEVTIDATPGVSFPAGSKVYLGIKCRVNPTSEVSYQTNAVLAKRVLLDDVFGTNYSPGEGTPYGLYNGKEVLLKKPNWITPVKRTIDAGVDVVDFDFGRREYDSYLDFVPSIFKAEYLNKSWEDAIDFLQFFIRQRGRRGEFYIPSPTSDLPLAADLVSGQSTFIVSDSAFSEYDSNPAKRNIVVARKDGTRLFRAVSGVTPSGSNAVFTTTGTWPENIAVGEISYVGWLNTYRFAVDELSLEWLSNSVAQFATSFQLLRDLDEAL